jgi:hypothetical protein
VAAADAVLVAVEHRAPAYDRWLAVIALGLTAGNPAGCSAATGRPSRWRDCPAAPANGCARKWGAGTPVRSPSHSLRLPERSLFHGRQLLAQSVRSSTNLERKDW